MFDSTNARTETPVQFTDVHDIPRGPIDGHGDPMAPIPGQRWFSDGPSLTWKHIGKKSFKLRIDMIMW